MVGRAYGVDTTADRNVDILLRHRSVLLFLVVALPWEGAFRWRVSGRDARGLEGPPSEDGLLAVELTRPD